MSQMWWPQKRPTDPHRDRIIQLVTPATVPAFIRANPGCTSRQIAAALIPDVPLERVRNFALGGVLANLRVDNLVHMDITRKAQGARTGLYRAMVTIRMAERFVPFDQLSRG